MGGIDPEYLKHQYLYVPWVDDSKVDTIEGGKAIGLYVAQHNKVRPTILCPLKSNAAYHDEFNKLTVVTERSGFVGENGVVIAWCPTRKVMQKLHGRQNIVVLVEWPSERFDAWAKLVGAYNVVTGEVMSAGLSEAGLKALEGIVWEGYNGWHDSIAETLTTAHLEELAVLGEYDRAIVLEYAAQHRGETSIQRLEKILDRYERGLAAA
ncbi:MAG: hypothetical protein ABGX78_08050 [Microbacterium sp.]|jgi:hypothetical protein|uniref:hypothetical protein n=1 Tax=Microbacterium sp. TaxID=51671 RepID=UPI003241D8C4|tara:strand:- start:180 stop:806 length:627 start_codon:yes stop_codon:yes gene_type:complete